MRATTSCDVGPAGLSTTIRPSIDGARDPCDEHLAEFVDVSSNSAAGRVLVSAASELLRDDAHVDLALGTHADAVLVAVGLLEEDHRLQLFHGQRLVDHALGVVVGYARR